MRRPKLMEDVKIALVFEAAVTTVSSFIFFFMSSPEMILLSIGIGLLIGYITWAIPMKVKSEVEGALEEYKNRFEILEAYAKVDKKEYLSIRNEILKNSVKALTDLAEGRIYDHWYYAWLTDTTARCDQRILAVSTMPEAEWSLPDEMKYYSSNVEARRRGIQVERIFVSTPERLKEKKNRRIILMHIADRIDTEIVYENLITDNALRGRVGQGFTVFENKDSSASVFVDELCPPSTRIGGAIMDGKLDADAYRNTFEQLRSKAEREPLVCLCLSVPQQDLLPELDRIFMERTGCSLVDLKGALAGAGKDAKTMKEIVARWERARAALGGQVQP